MTSEKEVENVWLFCGDLYKISDAIDEKKRKIFGDNEAWTSKFDAKNIDSNTKKIMSTSIYSTLMEYEQQQASVIDYAKPLLIDSLIPGIDRR